MVVVRSPEAPSSVSVSGDRRRRMRSVAPAADRASRWHRVTRSLDSGQWRTVALMASVVVGLHVLGFFLLIAVVAPHHYRLGASVRSRSGTGVTAYTLGLRHAFDADHISAIDNTTRKLMAEGKRPMSVGFFFSLGHSTIVFALAFLFSVGVKTLGGQVTRRQPPAAQLHQLDRHRRLGHLPVHHRGVQRGDPVGHRQGLQRDAPRHIRRGSSSSSS